MITTLVYSIFSLNTSLPEFVALYGNWIFVILFLIIFAETGLVIFPFLPGDSLLFIAGTVAASSGLNVHVLVVVLIIAAILGDSVNYATGRYIGPKVFSRAGTTGVWRLIKPSHLQQTHDFFEKHGAFSLVIGRFVPIVRTFVPFLAGVGDMTYRRFLCYNVAGAVLWITSVTYAGYLFGNIPWVKANFHWVVLGIIIVSVLPMVIQFLRERAKSKRQTGAAR
ncbi:MAG: DedA family protein [Anaerolineae bacterium]|nr:DedA family protein [Phycisphaerae bacterium]